MYQAGGTPCWHVATDTASNKKARLHCRELPPFFDLLAASLLAESDDLGMPIGADVFIPCITQDRF
jgi:hypothetical protein